jgi:serine/threonine protein kinase
MEEGILLAKLIQPSTNDGRQSSKSDSPDVDLSDRLANFFPRSKYSESDIQQIADLLRHINTAWSRVPRTYIVLRIIGQQQRLDEFINFGFTDHWFPVSSQQLPESLDSTARASLLQTQSVILAEGIDLKDGEDGRHMHFAKGVPLPFKMISILGSGGFGQVDKVVSKLSNNVYARKRIPRAKLFGKNRSSMKSYTSELEVLKRLKHRHVVKLVGSYTDPIFLGLVMSPVADCNLSDYLTQDPISPDKKSLLRSFFGCLATALAYLHNARIRHKDIKPQNILVKGDSILLTDFGLSLDSSDSTRSTTEGPTAMSLRYCAPEVFYYEPRNSSSDIWSLGCVFMEMVTVLKGEAIQMMRTYFESHGSHGQFFHNNFEATDEWLSLLSVTEPHSDNKPVQWIRKMLEPDRHDRLNVRTLVKTIQRDASIDPSVKFCGTCCMEDSDISEEDPKDSKHSVKDTGFE